MKTSSFLIILKNPKVRKNQSINRKIKINSCFQIKLINLNKKKIL